jgi:hypothetical protein
MDNVQKHNNCTDRFLIKLLYTGKFCISDNSEERWGLIRPYTGSVAQVKNSEVLEGNVLMQTLLSLNYTLKFCER